MTNSPFNVPTILDMVGRIIQFPGLVTLEGLGHNYFFNEFLLKNETFTAKNWSKKPAKK